MNISEIATLANKTGMKCSKADAFDIVKSAVDTNGKLSEAELAKLYRYFKPSATKAKAKKDVYAWLNQAVAKNDVRYYLNQSYCDGNRLIATDGHRLHLIKDVSLKEGFYDSDMNHLDNSNNDYGKFPDVDRVIPKADKKADWDIRGKVNVSGGIEYYEAFPESGFQKAYIDQAVEVLDEYTAYHSGKAGEALLIQGKHSGHDVEMVIMPMRLPK